MLKAIYELFNFPTVTYRSKKDESRKNIKSFKYK